jgi:hypothetical protein
LPWNSQHRKVKAPKKTNCVSITKKYLLKLFREIIVIHSEQQKIHKYTLWQKCTVMLQWFIQYSVRICNLDLQRMPYMWTWTQVSCSFLWTNQVWTQTGRYRTTECYLPPSPTSITLTRHVPYHGFVPPLVHLYTHHPLRYLRVLFPIVRHTARTLDVTKRPNGIK